MKKELKPFKLKTKKNNCLITIKGYNQENIIEIVDILSEKEIKNDNIDVKNNFIDTVKDKEVENLIAESNSKLLKSYHNIQKELEKVTKQYNNLYDKHNIMMSSLLEDGIFTVDTMQAFCDKLKIGLPRNFANAKGALKRKGNKRNSKYTNIACILHGEVYKDRKDAKEKTGVSLTSIGDSIREGRIVHSKKRPKEDFQFVCLGNTYNGSIKDIISDYFVNSKQINMFADENLERSN